MGKLSLTYSFIQPSFHFLFIDLFRIYLLSAYLLPWLRATDWGLSRQPGPRLRGACTRDRDAVSHKHKVLNRRVAVRRTKNKTEG